MQEENPFKQIETKKEVPREIKEKVMKDIASVKLATDLGDLFFVKFPSALEFLFNIQNKK